MAAQTPADALGEERGRALSRVIAFSDGVFAIAITLLVLNFRVPDVSGPNLNHKLLDALYDDWGLWLSYGLSFLIIAKFWTVHHRLSLLLRRIDSRFIALNLVFLACVVVLPFPTELLGTYGDTITATVLYAAAMTLAGLASGALWEHARRATLRRQGHRRLGRAVAHHLAGRSRGLRALDRVGICRHRRREDLLDAAVPATLRVPARQRIALWRRERDRAR